MTDIRVPALGESVTEATLASWNKQAGDAVKTDEIVCELETDKVSVEVPSPATGVISEILVAAGESVEVNALLATVSEAGASEVSAQSAASESEQPGGDLRSDPEAAAEAIDVVVPALGESVTEAVISAWNVQAGDRVSANHTLCELETDKVALEVNSPASGIVSRVLAEAGTTVAPGDRIAEIRSGPDDGGTLEPDSAQDAPSARRLMEEHGIDRSDVQGSGRDGRVMKPDVLGAIDKRRDSETPKPDRATGIGEADVAAILTSQSPLPDLPRDPAIVDDAAREERVRMTRLRMTIARRLKDAQNTAAILTTWNELDMTSVMEMRAEFKDLFQKKHGVKLGFMSFFTKACCIALKEIPEINAEIDGEDLVFRNYVNMGIAVGTPAGLVVPVIRNADALDFAGIEVRLAELGERAREGRLAIADLQGGTFTISNGGVYGSLMSSPILNPPQSGILGMHKIQERPVVYKGEITARPMMYLALSYDHRIVDGKGAVTFLVRVKEILEDPRRLLMDL